jgi:hypothetical protein
MESSHRDRIFVTPRRSNYLWCLSSMRWIGPRFVRITQNIPSGQNGARYTSGGDSRGRTAVSPREATPAAPLRCDRDWACYV